MPQPALEKRRFTQTAAIVIWLYSGALLIRLAAIYFWRFDGLYGQDAFAYYQQALAIANFDPKPFFWPNGYPLWAALWMGLLGKHEFAAQFATLICGAALPPFVYLLGRDLFPSYGERAGLWAGLIAAVAGQAVLSSIVIMADMPALLWATVACWFLVRWRHPGDLLAAGIFLGLAVVTRWAYALLAVPFAAYSLFQSCQNKTSPRLLLLPTLGGLAILLPQLWLSLDRPESLLHEWLINWRPANAFGRDFSHIDGEYNYTLPVALYNLQPLAHPNYMLPLLGLAALWGGWHLWRSRSWAALLLLGGWAGIVYLFLAGIPYENFRFGLTLYLPLLLLAGVGVEALRLKPPLRISRRMWGRGIYALLTVSLALMALWAVRSAHNFLTAQNASKQSARQVGEMLPTGATILSFGLTSTLQHYTDLQVIEFYNLDIKSLEAATATSCPFYLLIDLDNIAVQWQDRPPQVNYLWLQEHSTLTPLADFPPYTLFEVTANNASARSDPSSCAAPVSAVRFVDYSGHDHSGHGAPP
jgi:hypothetical protein